MGHTNMETDGIKSGSGAVPMELSSIGEGLFWECVASCSRDKLWVCVCKALLSVGEEQFDTFIATLGSFCFVFFFFKCFGQSQNSLGSRPHTHTQCRHNTADTTLLSDWYGAANAAVAHFCKPVNTTKFVPH